MTNLRKEKKKKEKTNHNFKIADAGFNYQQYSFLSLFQTLQIFLASYTDQNFYDDLHGELNGFWIKMKFI